MAEHDVRSAVQPVVFAGAIETAQVRLDAQHVEVVQGGAEPCGGGRAVAGVQAGEEEIERRQVLEAAVALAQIEVVRV